MNIIKRERKNREKQLKKARGIGGWAANLWERFMAAIEPLKGKKR